MVIANQRLAAGWDKNSLCQLIGLKPQPIWMPSPWDGIPLFAKCVLEYGCPTYTTSRSGPDIPHRATAVGPTGYTKEVNTRERVPTQPGRSARHLYPD